jgi:hypothetical protein
LLGVDSIDTQTAYLYLEFVRASRAWPWREMSPTARVLAQLAMLHSSSAPQVREALGATWDYEAELARQARATLDVFERAVRQPSLMHLCKYRPALRRMIAALPKLRHELLNLQPLKM